MKQAQTEPRAEIAICSRNECLRKRLSLALTHWAEEVCVNLALGLLDSVPEEGPSTGILFLDADGVDPAQLETLAPHPSTALVIVSSDKRMAIRAYRWHPAAFLSPDADFHAMRRAMDQCFPYWRQGLRWLDLPYRRERVRLPLCQLYCAEADGWETILYCAGGQMRTSTSLGKLWEELPSPPFLRCQRGFLVHLSAVDRMIGGVLILVDSHRAVSVSRQQSKDIQRILAQWRSARRG